MSEQIGASMTSQQIPTESSWADVVVLNRVVCCYPDYERLLGAAADHAKRLLVFTYPPRNAISRLLIGLQNLTFKLRGKEFRVFVHASGAMFGVVEERGLHLAHVHRPVVWQVAGFVRHEEPGMPH